MPYNASTDAALGYVSKRHKEKLDEMAAHTNRKKRAMMEWLIDQEYEKMLKEAQNA